MKRTLCLMLAGMGMAAFAAIDDVVVTFSTKGPDAYADGRRVLDGECYALVWTPTGKQFSGIDANGAAVGEGKVVAKLAVAKGGRCPDVLFQVSRDYVDRNYPGGTWGVCLLDTRTFAIDADGAIVTGDDGLPKVVGCGGVHVNGYGLVSSAAGEKLSLSSGAAASAASGAVGELKIRDFKLIEGGFVQLTVAGSLSTQKLAVRSGAVPTALDACEERYGKTGEDLIIVRPVKPEGEFFKLEAK